MARRTFFQHWAIIRLQLFLGPSIEFYWKIKKKREVWCEFGNGILECEIWRLRWRNQIHETKKESFMNCSICGIRWMLKLRSILTSSSNKPRFLLSLILILFFIIHCNIFLVLQLQSPSKSKFTFFTLTL